MRVSEYRDTLDRLTSTNSRKEKKEIIREVSQAPTGSEAAISFLSGSEFDDIGLGKKTVLSCAQDVFGSFEPKPTVSQAVDGFDSGNDSIRQTVENLREDMDNLAEMSGNEQQEYLRKMFEWYEEPAVVAHACLDDLPTGCSDKTIADATDVRDSLPFVESVVEAVEMENPPTEPEVGEPFSPQLAKSESSLPEWQTDRKI